MACPSRPPVRRIAWEAALNAVTVDGSHVLVELRGDETHDQVLRAVVDLDLALRALQQRQEGLGDGQRAGQVHLELAAELVEGEVGQRTADGDAGVPRLLPGCSTRGRSRPVAVRLGMYSGPSGSTYTWFRYRSR